MAALICATSAPLYTGQAVSQVSQEVRHSDQEEREQAPYFHSPVKAGGLVVMKLQYRIPALRERRERRILNVEDPAAHWNTGAIYVAHRWIGSDSTTLTGEQDVKNIQLRETSNPRLLAMRELIQGRANYVSAVAGPEL